MEDHQLKSKFFVQSSNGHDILHVICSCILQEKDTRGMTYLSGVTIIL